jgi:hypothetical protein
MRQTKASTGRSKFDQGKNLAEKQQNLLDLSSVKFQGEKNKTKQNKNLAVLVLSICIYLKLADPVAQQRRFFAYLCISLMT